MQSPLSHTLQELNTGKGYTIGGCDATSLDLIWDLVLESFSGIFSIASPDRNDMINIHNNPRYKDCFPSLSVYDRTLSKEASKKIIQSDFVQELQCLLPYSPAADNGFTWPSFTWRLVRPAQSSDFRALHRDRWFRVGLFGLSETGGPLKIAAETPFNIQTIKVWLALNVVPGKSGLLVSPSSQLFDEPSFKLHHIDNMIKPIIIESESNVLPLIHADTCNGQYVLFGENLVHGGALTETPTSRVSLEFTLACKDQSHYKTFFD